MSTTGNAKSAEKKPSTGSCNFTQNSDFKAQQKSFVFGSSTPREFSHMARSERQSRRNEDLHKSKSDSAHNIAFYMHQARSITPKNTGDRMKGWVFGSSTPREFSYLNRLKAEHRVYDTKCTPNETPKVLASKSAMTLTPKNSSHDRYRSRLLLSKPTISRFCRRQIPSPEVPHQNLKKGSGGKPTTVVYKPTVPPKVDKPKTSEKGSTVTNTRPKMPEKERTNGKAVEISINSTAPSSIKEKVSFVDIIEISKCDSNVLKNEVSAIAVSDPHTEGSKPEDVLKVESGKDKQESIYWPEDKQNENKLIEENKHQTGVNKENQQHKPDFSENHFDDDKKNDNEYDHNTILTDETVLHGVHLQNDDEASSNRDQSADLVEPSQLVTIE